MSQTTKKAAKAAKSTSSKKVSAARQTRKPAEKIATLGNKAVQDFICTSNDEAQKAQQKALDISREGAEHIAKSADAASKALYEAASFSRGNVETAIECSNTSAALAQDLSNEVLAYANDTFSEQLEVSKEFFACRTLNDMVELQTKLFRSNIDNFFSESVKLSEMVFEYTNEALEPINERVAQATDQVNKALSNK